MELRRIPLQAAGIVVVDARLDQAFVDRRARAGRALVVHRGDDALVAGLLVFLKQDDLGILAAEFYHGARVGVQMVDRQGDSVDLLNEARADRLAQRTRAGPGDKHSDVLAGDVLERQADSDEQLERLLTLSCLVALVVGPENLFRRRIDDDGFDSGRADVNPDDDGISRRHHRRAAGARFVAQWFEFDWAASRVNIAWNTPDSPATTANEHDGCCRQPMVFASM